MNMALKHINQVKQVRGNTALSLTADSGESFRIKDIHVYSPANNYVKAFVNRTEVMYLRVGGTLGNHCPFPITDEPNRSIFGELVRMELIRPIPVASGQTFSIEDLNDSDSVVAIVYDIYDEADVQPTEPNGTEANEYDYFNYGRLGATATGGTDKYITQQTDNEFPGFPFGENVPANHEIDVKAIFASEVGKRSGTGANGQYTTYLKMVRNRITLFDWDKNGHLLLASTPATDTTTIGAGQSFFGNWSDVDERPPMVFEEPLTFYGGEDFDIFLSTTLVSGSANLLVTDTEIMTVQTVRRKG